MLQLKEDFYYALQTRSGKEPELQHVNKDLIAIKNLNKENMRVFKLTMNFYLPLICRFYSMDIALLLECCHKKRTVSFLQFF